MLARDLMQSPAVTILGDDTVAHLCDVLQEHHVNGAPVVDEAGNLVGIVTEEDIVYGGMSSQEAGEPQRTGSRPGETQTGGPVSEIMTSPAVCATEDTSLIEVCRLMWTMRIHRIPIVRGRRVVGIVTAMDVVRAISEGRILP